MFQTLSELIEASKKSADEYIERMKAEEEARNKKLLESPPQEMSK